jgi:outer membrane protein assembly factor BamB
MVVSLVLLVALFAIIVGHASGKDPLWVASCTAPASSVNPLADRGVVYAPSGSAVASLNITNGAVNWIYSLESDDNAGYIAVDGADAVFVGSVKRVTALDRLTGSVLWVYDVPLVPYPPSPGTHCRPSFSGGMVYVTTGNTPLVSLHASTGRLAFELPSGGIAQLHATRTKGDRVYFVNQYFPNTNVAVCANATTGDVLWTVSNIVTIIVAEEVGLLYGQYGSAAGSGILAVNLTTGAMVGNLSYPSMQALDYFYDGRTTLYVDIGATTAPYPTKLLALDAATFALRWSVIVSFLFFLPVEGGIVNFGPNITEMYSRTGKQVWSYAEVTAASDGAAGDGVVVFATGTQLVALSIA